MQTVLAFLGQTFGSGAAAASSTAAATTTAAASTAAAASTTATAASWASTALSALKVGTSVVSALSVFGQADLQAQALRQQSQDLGMQSRQEFIQSQQNANDINARYNAFVAQETAVAGASGIDLASGSVVEAQRLARADADRELAINRSGVETNAALRQGRAAYLSGAAALTSQVGLASAAAKVGGAIFDARRTG